jgi:phenylacetate-CoA ligase
MSLGDWQHIDELTALQDKALPELLSGIGGSPFYRERLGSRAAQLRTRADLDSVPLTSKQDLRDGYPFGFLAVPKRDLATYHESSGTAGMPTASYYTERDWQTINDNYARKWTGITSDDVFLVRTPYALMISGNMAHAAARACGALVVPGDNRSLAMPYSRVLRVLHDLGVSLSWSMPTEPLMWAAAARAHGYDPATDFPALRALFVGGEPLSVNRRKRISEIWGVPVVEEYGATETPCLGGQCAEGRMHLWADQAIYEVYDPATGTLSRDGRGQLVVTQLYREAMPLLRYNIGDEVEVSLVDDCACGWHLPTVRVLGRSGFGHPVGDTRVTQSELEDLVFALPLTRQVLFWRGRASPAMLEIQIEVPDEQRDVACAELTAAIAGRFGCPSEVTGVPVGTLVPTSVFTGIHDVVKPRSLFGADEDWSKALLYQ